MEFEKDEYGAARRGSTGTALEHLYVRGITLACEESTVFGTSYMIARVYGLTNGVQKRYRIECIGGPAALSI